MQPRIEPASPPFTEDTQAALDRIMPPGVPPLTLFTTLARDQRLFSRFFAGGLLDKGHLTLRQREIVIHRVTAQCGSEYEWGVHAAFFAPRVQLSDEQLYSLVHGDSGDACWAAPEQRLIQLCDALHATCTLDATLWTQLRADYSENAMLELLMLAGYYRTVSYLTNAVQLPLEGFGRRFPDPDSSRNSPGSVSKGAPSL